MGLRFYIGPAGSGKSHAVYGHVIREAIANPHRNYLIVTPDQFTMQTQLEVVRMHPDRGIMNIDVLGFGRLARRVFDEVGGGNGIVLDDTGKSLVLRHVAAGIEDGLGIMKRNIKKPGYIGEVKSAVSEFMQYGLSPDDVGKLSEYASRRGMLSQKLKDLDMLYRGFLDYINGHYVTTEETLDLLGNVLSKSSMIRDSVVVFDEFTGFTPVQYRLMQKFMECAGETIVTVTIGKGEDPYTLDGEQKLFYLGKKTLRDLDRLCKESGVRREKDVFMDGTDCRHGGNPGLSHLERGIFRYPCDTFEGGQDGVRVFEASNPKEELRQVCLEIKRLVREKGYCWRDFAVVTGDLGRYDSHARELFGTFGIPCFIDQTRRLVLNPFVEFVRSALLVIIHDYSYESVFHFLRSGMTGISADDVDVLENYCISLGIRGRKTWEKMFKRYPGSRDRDWSSELAGINSIRERFVSLMEPLSPIKKDGKISGEEFVNVLYGFITNASVEEKLALYEQKFSDSLDFARAKEYGQVYRLVMDLLDQICGLMGGEEMCVREFADILDAGFSEIRVGTIPQAVDRVVIGDIERTRIPEVKVLFFMGVNDGIIPKSGGTGGIISDIDREFLQESGFELAPTPRQQMYIQKYYLYLMMTKPTDRLYLSYAGTDNGGHATRPSYLISAVLSMFPGMTVDKPQARPMQEQIESHRDALGYLVSMIRRYADGTLSGDEGFFASLYGAYASDRDYKETVEQMRDAAFPDLPGMADNRLPKELARMLYGTVLHNSVSRLEKFASCAYAHFLKYGLDIEERGKYAFKRVDMGNVFHAVLESFSGKIKETGYTWLDFPEEFGESLVAQCLEDYAVAYGETVLYSSHRNEYMITRMNRILNRTVKVLQKQLKQGSFMSEDFELSFQSMSDLDSVNFNLSDDEKMKLSGRIDRVDTCRSDGKTYVKVIDYKSGNRRFNLAALYYGLQLQLVVYMNAAMEVIGKRTTGDTDVVPAAMLYYHVDDPMTETEKGKPDPSEIDAAIMDKLKMTGVVSDDDGVIRLMDRNFETSSSILPVARKKDGSFTQASTVLSKDDFGTVSEFTNRRIRELGSSIMDGKIGLTPCTGKDIDSCAYCEYRGICGFDRKTGSGLVRRLDDMGHDEAMERIRNEMGNNGEKGE